ncbi:M20 family metallopeptidase [Enterovirga rhinocerotis]|uniref:Acetylornithine deacetylase/succinyl-diaminopimelate desuccinylase-like protein n=1 Tax=Enterovirga rhinocerotis TaxID=1339210 RepID=A0A4R7BYI3_9HYPH|nr:M20 family metallopeptidase [Enterovirga rhinocerotis]TDR89086.1 acetylornithine deacetylase/succinyl-diaminopimelate desuccinylase-like protein [Enterovirga rhinocerotis]
MTRDAAIAEALHHFDSGAFRADLARRIAIPTESQNPARAGDLRRYLTEDLTPAFEALGFSCRLIEEPKAKGPFLYAERIEDPALLTVFGYGHGDVIRGLEEQWKDGLDPWTLTERGGLWYGRGIADNKGQHSVNLAAQAAVLKTRGKLGFNAKWLIETGEETGSAGLREVCRAHRDLFRSDVLIGSDGPRPDQMRPTIYLGTRGGASFDVFIDAREGGHHSGNWGGLLSSPAIQLVHALSTITSPTGEILIPEWRPKGGLPAKVREALAGLELDMGEDAPVIDPTWSEPGFTGPEKVFGWCAFEILAMESGNPKGPVNAVPPSAWARCQLRFVVGVEMDDIIPALRRHLDKHGFGYVQVEPAKEEVFPATRLDPDNPWVSFALGSMRRSSEAEPLLLPNLGGSLPNDAFSDILALPTVWVPHSYNGCSQHAPNEHLPPALLREALAVMAGLYWDIPESGIAKG